jgi:acetolactate synthase-1/2/3 large subunit
MRQRVPGTSNPVTHSLTSLQDPALDWVSLAKGMGVPATRAETAEQLCEQLQQALAEPGGPHLIQAVLSMPGAGIH